LMAQWIFSSGYEKCTEHTLDTMKQTHLIEW